MKKINLTLLLALLCLYMSAQENHWSRINESQINKDPFQNRYRPSSYQLFRLNASSLTTSMRNAPSERTTTSNNSGFILSMPDADGQTERFRVVEASIMAPELAAKYPDIKSYAGT